MWLYLYGTGVVGVFVGVEVFVLGTFFHVLENFTWYCVGVGLMGCVSVWVLVVLCRTFCSSCGVIRWGGMFV
jgi:hypothetical protein